MKKNFLKHINLWLGSISVALAGCHIQKQPTEPVPANEPDTPVVEKPKEPDPPVCIYGPPSSFYKDEDEPQPRKYGPPVPVERKDI